MLNPLSLSLLFIVPLFFICDATETPNATILTEQHLRGLIRSDFIDVQTKSFTGHTCANNSDCQSPRVCWDVFSDGMKCNSSSFQCLCNYEDGNRKCSTSEDCAKGDRCISTSLLEYEFCFSCNRTEELAKEVTKVDSNPKSCKLNNGNNETDVCIAVSSLQNVHPSKLVYKAHRKAGVLCDKLDNCATPGHIVEYKGRGMMMKTYCMQVKCTKRVKLVNNIRMQAGFRVASKSPHLQFTALAARYETTLEEVILRQIIRSGI